MSSTEDMAPAEALKTRIAVAVRVRFTCALPVVHPPTEFHLPHQDNPRFWPRSTKEIGRRHLSTHLKDIPRARGVLVDGKVYSDDRIFWFNGILKSAQKYPIVYDKPDFSDVAQLHRDKVCGVLYASDFPQAEREELESDIPIIFLNEMTWKMDQGEEIKYCHKIDNMNRQKRLDDDLRTIKESFYELVLKELNMTIDDPRIDRVANALLDPLIVAAVRAADAVQDRLIAEDAAARNVDENLSGKEKKRFSCHPLRALRKWIKG